MARAPTPARQSTPTTATQAIGLIPVRASSGAVASSELLVFDVLEAGDVEDVLALKLGDATLGAGDAAGEVAGEGSGDEGTGTEGEGEGGVHEVSGSGSVVVGGSVGSGVGGVFGLQALGSDELCTLLRQSTWTMTHSAVDANR